MNNRLLLTHNPEEELRNNRREGQAMGNNKEERKKIPAVAILVLAKMWKKIPPVAILLLAKMTNLDVVYTAIERAISTNCDNNCNMTNLDVVYTATERAISTNCDNNIWIVAWVYWAVYFLVFLILCLYELWTYENEEAKKGAPAQDENGETREEILQGNKKNEENRKRTSTGNTMANLKQYVKWKCTRILMIVIAFLVSVFAGFYTLADTRLPLACIGDLENWIRFGLWVFNSFVAAAVIILWMYWQCTHDNERYATLIVEKWELLNVLYIFIIISL